MFTDGTSQPVDVVVLATGYENMRESARALLGDAVADRCTPVWGLDDEGELRTIWRRSGHPGFWFMSGNLHRSRHYSQFLALQIKAIEEGLIRAEARACRSYPGARRPGRVSPAAPWVRGRYRHTRSGRRELE